MPDFAWRCPKCGEENLSLTKACGDCGEMVSSASKISGLSGKSATRKNWSTNWWKLLGVVVVISVILKACAPIGEKWNEEVLLSDGKVLVVERETVRERGGAEWAANSSGSKPTERRIRFKATDGSGQMIEWISKKIDPQTYPEYLLFLDAKPGQIVVFSILAVSPVCEIYSKYVYSNGVWSEELLPEKFAPISTNLLIRDGVDMPKYVTLEDKRKANSDSGYRESLKQVGPTRQICGG